jgi:hypothetical protein
MIEEAFGQPPLIAQLANSKSPDVLFFAGPAVSGTSTLALPGLVQATYKREASNVEKPLLATDDWPYLNLPDQTISWNYVLGLGSMILVSMAFIVFFVTPAGSRPITASPVAWCFFLQGAGFMLIEANTITRMALILGSTWIVTSVAVILVLLAALVSNFIVLRFAFPSVPVGIGLVVVAALVNYMVDVHLYMNFADGVRVPLAALQVYLPILGSSFVFGRLFQRSNQSSYDLGMNILGAMFGGMLEYSSLIAGTRNVYLVAVLFFLAILPAYYSAQRGRRNSLVV